METTEKIKCPPIIFCSICGKEILQHEDFDYSQSKRHSTVYWHKRCYNKARRTNHGE